MEEQFPISQEGLQNESAIEQPMIVADVEEVAITPEDSLKEEPIDIASAISLPSLPARDAKVSKKKALVPRKISKKQKAITPKKKMLATETKQ